MAIVKNLNVENWLDGLRRIDNDRHIQVYKCHNLCRAYYWVLLANFQMFEMYLVLLRRCVPPFLWNVNQRSIWKVCTNKHETKIYYIYVAKRVPATKCKSPFQSRNYWYKNPFACFGAIWRVTQVSQGFTWFHMVSMNIPKQEDTNTSTTPRQEIFIFPGTAPRPAPLPLPPLPSPGHFEFQDPKMEVLYHIRPYAYIYI